MALCIQLACLKSCRAIIVVLPLGSQSGASLALTSMLAQIADMYRSQAIANQKGIKDED